MSDNITKLGVTKRYQNFIELLKDVPTDYPEVESGIIILFDKDGGMLVLPVCQQSQLAYAAADLLAKAVGSIV